MIRKSTSPSQPDALLTGLVDPTKLNAIAELQTSRRHQALMRALARVATGEPVKQAARAERLSRKTLNIRIADYNQGGLEAILPARRGRPPALTDQQIIKTRAALLHEQPVFQTWTPLLLSLWLKEQFGVRYRPDA